MTNLNYYLRTVIIMLWVIILGSQDIFAEERYIVIDKPNLRMYLIEKEDTLMNVPICAGRNYGNKMRSGDSKTPEGTFYISQIQDSRLWEHDFGDGMGMRKNAYGPWFLRLKTPKWTSIGIHGTCFPSSIGTRDSEGCIRLLNEDLMKLKKLVNVGTKVVILKDNAETYNALPIE